MKKIEFSYSALLITILVVSLAGCSQKRELDQEHSRSWFV
jgi:uncharacterized lipoprotein YehR (DUF1307 family)